MAFTSANANSGGKTTNFELDARVPLIISDTSKENSTSLSLNSLAELVDLIPTLTELAGVPTPERTAWREPRPSAR